jgi:multidrug resistance efflux pump
MSNETIQTSAKTHSYPAWLVTTLRVALPFVILVGAFLLYRHLLATPPQHQRRQQDERAAIVQTRTLQTVSRTVNLSATGTVVPSRSLTLTARVSGEVIATHPNLEPGGFLKAGETLVQLDRDDYELALRRAQTTLAQAKNSQTDAEVKLAQAREQLIQSHTQETQTEALVTQAQAAVVTANYAYKVELGQQDVAKHEWTLVEDRDQASELDRELTLRKPHLQKAQADVDSAKAGVKSSEAALLSAKADVKIAQASVRSAEVTVASAKDTVADAQTALEQAQLNLQRTTVTVPFNAVVLERAVALGTMVSTQTELASLVAADAFWVEVSLPQDRLSWIDLPQDGQPGAAAVVSPSGAMTGQAVWEGRVIRRLPQLETNGRRARLLVEVSQPLAQGKTPLLLDSFVKVELQGPQLKDVFEIPRETVHNGKEIWLRNAEGRLEVKPVSPVWSDGDNMLVAKGLQVGQELIVSDVASPIPGMKVALAADSAKTESVGFGKTGTPLAALETGTPLTALADSADRKTNKLAANERPANSAQNSPQPAKSMN